MSGGAALITGASSGIGLELAKLFAQDGHDLVLVARRGDRLRELAAGLASQHRVRSTLITVDLADPGTPPEIARSVAASTAGFVPGPLMAVYYATKAYVISFSEALAEELTGSGATVTVLCPGATRTEFWAAAGTDADARLLRRPWVADAASVARAGYEGLRAGKRMVIPGFANKVMVQGMRVAPRVLLAKLARRLQESVRG